MKSLKTLVVFLLVLNSVVFVKSDPPVLPPPHCPMPCPLICFQITGAHEIAPDHWRFEFEVLNWTAYHDPALTNRCVGSLTGVTSDGAAATGLTLVRVASLSSAQISPAAVDPNGAPYDVLPEVQVPVTLTRQPDGRLGAVLDCQNGFIAEITSVVNNSATGPATGCSSLIDCVQVEGTLQEPVLVFNEAASCGGYFAEGDQVTVGLRRHASEIASCDARVNDWTTAQCTNNEITWRAGTENGDTSIPAGDSIMNPCPTTCDEKDAGDNVLDGFVIEIRDFQIGERVVFNWYLSDDSGPIAAGSPPTATDQGTLSPSPKDPVGFSFGSFQIDRVASCLDGSCDTMIMGSPSINDPALTCLVDVPGVPRNEIPFDFYVSMMNAGPSSNCGVAPVVVEDAKGIDRLMVRATPSETSDRIRVVFESGATTYQVTRDRLLNEPFFDIDPYDFVDDQGVQRSLQGEYHVSGACFTGPDNFSLIAPVTIAFPQRGDKPTIDGGSDLAFELNPSTASYSATGTLPGSLATLGNDLSYCHILQIRDNTTHTTHVVALEEGTDLKVQGARHYKDNTAAPVLDHILRYGAGDAIQLGTNHDGGTDCQVDVAVTVSATDEAGSFQLTNTHDSAVVPSYTAHQGSAEAAQQTVYDTFTVGAPTNITFTATDHAGNSSNRTISVQIVDDTLPKGSCALIPLTTPPGGGRGSNNSGGCSNRFQVVYSSTDNCDASPELIAADLDGIDLMALFAGNPLGKIITILKNANLAQAAQISASANEDLRIQTPLGGVLTVTFRDDAGNTFTCQSTQSLPTVSQIPTSGPVTKTGDSL